MARSYSTIEIILKKRKPKASPIYDTYWRFAAERQEVFYRRIQRDFPPWTNDRILRSFKFTNAYRATDRVSQYLIKSVIYSTERTVEDVFFRILLFKLFNKIETWNLLEESLGDISYQTYNYTQYNNILESAKMKGEPIYSGAYIMASGGSAFGQRFKHQNHLKLLEKMMSEKLPRRLQDCKSMQEVYELLLTYPTIGEFLAYQYAVDVNYSTITNFSEMDFVKAGPGAKDGIFKCFTDLGEYSFEDIISYMTDHQETEFSRLEIDFKRLWGRELQKIDCQNIFCEVDKYTRVAYPDESASSKRKRIKQKFTFRGQDSISYFFPPKWNINHLIQKSHE